MVDFDVLVDLYQGCQTYPILGYSPPFCSFIPQKILYPWGTHFVPHLRFHHKIRPDQLWAYLIRKKTTNCEQMKNLLSYVYSIPCSNAFTEGVFSHMKHSWTASRNSMSSETVAAELQIRLNCKMKCSDFFALVQNEPELIRCARSSQKYSHIKKTLL